MTSLRKRFLEHTAIVIFVTMLLSVVVIERHYVAKTTEQAQLSLRIHLYALLSVAFYENGELTLPALLSNPDFNASPSNLWAVVFDGDKNPVWQSLSSPEQVDDVSLPTNTGNWHYSQQSVLGQQYLTASYSIVWDQTTQSAYHIVVAENIKTIADDIAEFRLTLAVGVTAITLLLLTFHYLVLRNTFKPIAKLESEIAEMEKGNLKHLSDNYPRELAGVAANLNTLIDKEYSQRERYRSALADLAHSLKTPITIINGELNQYPENPTLQNALTRIDNSIEYQLRRAVISGHKFLSKGTAVREILEMVLDAMQKIYSNKNTQVTADIDDSVMFYGDENDLLEIFGNLLDNAFKYGEGKVVIRAKQNQAQLTLEIEDNGPGFSEYDQNRIFNRGERLDQQGLGQGIGLAVVFDILQGYEGQIRANSSTLGGAKFTMIFPRLRHSKSKELS